MNGPASEGDTTTGAQPALDLSARRKAVDRAREFWIRRLIDLSRRNNLLYYRDLKTGTLDLTAGDRNAFDLLLAGETVILSRFVPSADETIVHGRAHEIRRRALANLEEKGLETLYLALGMASWAPADEGRPPEAPVLLFPVAIEVRGREGRTLALKGTGDVQVNPVLLHVLESGFGCRVTLEMVLAPEEGEHGESRFTPEAAYKRLIEAAANIKGFGVKPRVVLGNFAFQKMAMVRDLREHGDALAAHDVIAAIAGDGGARASVLAGHREIDVRTLDQIPPANEFLILDADASQQRAVHAALSDQDGVIHGPPGTGKSQTIANLIAAFAATGRRVLFVAEKRAALEVVLRRLAEVGLGHLALDLHGADVSRRAVMKQVAESLTTVHESMAVKPDDLHRRFIERRTRLNEHVTRLHAPRSPCGLSVYELQGGLLGLTAEAKAATTRWRGADLDRLNRLSAESVRDLLVEVGGFGGLFLRDDPSPWTGARLTDGAKVQEATDAASRLAASHWPGFISALTIMSSTTGLRAPTTLDEAARITSLLAGVEETLHVYADGLFTEDLDSLVAALAPASRGRFSTAWAWCSDVGFRGARRTLFEHRRAGRAPASQLLAEASVAAHHRRRWRALASADAIPHAYPNLQSLRTSLRAVLADVETLQGYLARGNLNTMEFGALGRLIAALAADTETPPRLPRLLELERAIEAAGAGAVVAELRQRRPAPPLWPAFFESAWLASCLDRARAEDPGFAGFNGRTHDQFVKEFSQMDRERLAVAAARVRRAHAEQVIAVMNTKADQDALVRREAAKSTRHLPLRRLVAEAPDVLTALRPCWMASPLSVSQLLPADRRLFDVVIFDEASQVLPEDGVPAVLRGARAIVAGDRNQLPPTTFFAAGEDEEDEAADVAPAEGFESLLDIMTSFLQPRPLIWHYRSRDEALIAFSNRHIYGDSLVTFPGPGGPPAVRHVLVALPTGRDGLEESPSPEVERVAQLVLEHAERRPKETLGVIALGITHARRVETAIEAALGDRPDLDAFFDQQLPERFFVKNLERVQGDERDAIILTLGAGKDRAGRLDHRQFGPLNQKGGERRLNVAVTRARGQMTLVSSFTHTDMDPGSPGRGAELLRFYLEYAATGGARLGDGGVKPFSLNEFELDVRDTLEGKGLSLLPQWGASRYRIDFVARHPTRPGRFVLAIECDGASYHSAPTARDRDRLRQQHLEALGWRFHRIWSTDWFMRREEEIGRALTAFEGAVAHADRHDASPQETTAVRPSGESLSGGASARILVDPGRGARPPVTRRQRIEDYSRRELESLVRWILSDGRLRTDDELVSEMIEELGFSRRGRIIEAAILGAINRVRSNRAGG